jgi:hypothetical protein
LSSKACNAILAILQLEEEKETNKKKVERRKGKQILLSANSQLSNSAGLILPLLAEYLVTIGGSESPI